MLVKSFSRQSSSRRCWMLGAALMLAATLPATAALAEHKVAQSHEQHEKQPHFIAGVKGGTVIGFADGHTAHHEGVGVFFGMTLLPHWLEIELEASVLAGEHSTILPIDLTLVKPFHLNHVVEPFVGIGPTVVIAFEDEKSVHFGGVVVAGSYFWLGRWGGLVAKVNYGLVYEHGPVHELGLSAGVAFHW